jgi:hypothetical protein
MDTQEAAVEAAAQGVRKGGRRVEGRDPEGEPEEYGDPRGSGGCHGDAEGAMGARRLEHRRADGALAGKFCVWVWAAPDPPTVLKPAWVKSQKRG